MKEAPTPSTMNYTCNLQHNNKNYKLDINQKETNIIISCTELNSLPLNIFKSEYTNNSLYKLSKFFLLFENTTDSFPEIISKIKKNEIKIYIDDNQFKLTVMLNIINCQDFSFNLYKKELNLDITVENLCEEMNILKSENKKLKEENEDFKKRINILEKEMKEIKEKLLPLKEEKVKEESFFPESKILKNNEDKQLIFNWIKPNAKIKLTLLFQASQDGDKISTFYSKVGNICPTIILIKTKAGFKCGGYTTNTWKNINNYKKDELAFLFSIDKKKKYPVIKEKITNSIYTCGSYIAFGGGHDLRIDDQFKANTIQYCNFPYTYSNGDKSELTGGQYNFLIEELEVYHVEFI